MIYFTADEHFDHENIIIYCNRPFQKLHAMNHTIINNFNGIVRKEDTTYHLGDFTLRGPENWGLIRNWVKQLNGNHILILGNHDKLNPFLYVECGFMHVHTYQRLTISQSMLHSDDLLLHLIHDPAITVVDQENWWLCGHIHTLFKQTKKVINVGVDVWDFKPVSIETIKQIIEGETNVSN
jgi:calcineurin-like phosphoesterase family protein